MYLTISYQHCVVKSIHPVSHQGSLLRLCEAYMERSCRVSLICDKPGVDPKLESMYRSAALASKVWFQQKKSVFESLHLWFLFNIPSLFTTGGSTWSGHCSLRGLHQTGGFDTRQCQFGWRNGRAGVVQKPISYLGRNHHIVILGLQVRLKNLNPSILTNKPTAFWFSRQCHGADSAFTGWSWCRRIIEKGHEARPCQNQTWVYNVAFNIST